MKIEIAGKEAGIKFNMYAVEKLATLKGDITNSSFVVGIVFAGLQGWFFAQQKEINISFDEVDTWVGKQAFGVSKELNEIIELWKESEGYKNLVKKGAEIEDSKKKLNGTKSTRTRSGT